MPHAVVVVRFARLTPDRVKRRDGPDAFRALIAAVEDRVWPYDTSDDPAFFSARHFGAAITWGICRPQLRCLLREGDVVVFISSEDEEGTPVYRFCGFGTVAGKVTQDAVWRADDLAVFRDYLNLLITPDGPGAFVHQVVHPDHPHADWLWRLVCERRNDWRKSDFAGFGTGARIRPGVDLAANGQRIRFGANYVIFDEAPRHTHMLARPVVIATRNPRTATAPHEIWADSEAARTLYELTLNRGARGRRFLRVSNNAYGHPHVRLVDDAANWRREALETLNRLRLASC
jgi:hypothetical protein